MESLCQDCLTNTECDLGDHITVNKGFWRASLNSTNIYLCPKESSCLGGYAPEKENPVNCADGYSKYLCQVCVHNETI
jgi:hypothetical protein